MLVFMLFTININQIQTTKRTKKSETMVKMEQAMKRKKLIQTFKGNLKKFYGYMRQLQSRPIGIGDLKKMTGEITQSEAVERVYPNSLHNRGKKCQFIQN